MEFVMAANGGERAGGVVRHSDNETAGAGTGAPGRVDAVDAKNGGETPQAPKPLPVEFGWDFPFDSPKPAR